MASQFGPLPHSLSSDAPGYLHAGPSSSPAPGPACWKCRGSGLVGASPCPVCPTSHPGYLPRKKLKPHLPRSKADETLARAHGFLIEVPPARRLEPAHDAQLASREGCAALPPPPGAAALHATLSKLSYVPPEPTDPPSTFSYSSLLGSSRILQEAKGGHRYVEAKRARRGRAKRARRRRPACGGSGSQECGRGGETPRTPPCGQQVGQLSRLLGRATPAPSLLSA
jgi:hypothetical protein